MTVAKAKVIETQDLSESEPENEATNSERESGSSENSDVPDEQWEDEQGTSNAGWADSISKILKTNKPKGKKTLVLSKAKKLTDIKQAKTKPAGFQVATEDGEIKEEQFEIPEALPAPPKKRKREDIGSVRVKPDILQKDRERTLAKIATRGVVQLFNAVRMQQKDIDKKLEDAGPLDAKRDKVLKSIDKKAFLKVLMGEKSQVVDDETTSKQQKTKQETGTWSVLRDDFMMGAKLKDWDKQVEVESEDEAMIESE